MFEPNSTIGWASGKLRASAIDLVQYLRAPTLTPTDGQMSGKPTDLVWLFAVNCGVVALLAIILFPAMLLFDIEMSGDMSELFARPVWQILAIVVIVGPIMEELFFRTWLSGLPRLLVPLCAVIAWLIGSAALRESGASGPAPTELLLLGGGIAVAALIGSIWAWKKPVPGWYIRMFPGIFWIQALLFGFMHVFNYAGDNPAALLPFILPQLTGGLIWGYARIRYGWWANIIMHMAYNLIATSGLLYMLLAGKEIF
ncbi:CPBP family glutamic-type intramembrane protease [Parasphingorhabdus sp.]|uniref:CPBP family glutamic-type intramembrane protease n=1 Tax=Parasphingorhabdus sp. TaxID=2709688 RepID=UPI003267A002